jgi:hypothetical protein
LYLSIAGLTKFYKIVVIEKDLFNFCGAGRDGAVESSGRKLMRSLGELNRRWSSGAMGFESRG